MSHTDGVGPSRVESRRGCHPPAGAVRCRQDLRRAHRPRRPRPGGGRPRPDRLVGANGSGKSTLLRICTGTEDADTGTVARRRGMVTSIAAAAGRRRPAHAAPDRAGGAARPGADRAGAGRGRRARLADPALAGDLDRMERVLRRQAVLLEEFEQARRPRLRGPGARAAGRPRPGRATRSTGRPTCAAAASASSSRWPRACAGARPAAARRAGDPPGRRGRSSWRRWCADSTAPW